MPAAEAGITTEHAARYLSRLCGHVGKMGTVGRLGHRPPSRAGDVPPEVRRGECSGTEGNRQPDLGPVDHAGLSRLAGVRAEAADEDSLRQIQDLLTARLQTFGRREHLTVTWRRPAEDA